MNDACVSNALIELGELLLASGYAFTTTTPISHQRVLARPSPAQPTLRDIFGWSHAFGGDDLPPPMFAALIKAGAATHIGDKFRSRVRYSTLGDQLFVHSAFPTDEANAVFFGPDTYRFARVIRSFLNPGDLADRPRILDVGAGSGAGGLHAAHFLSQRSPQIVLADINQSALEFSRVNAALNKVAEVSVIYSDLYAQVDGPFDVIISNPPYLVDPRTRTYRHGGGEFGSELSLRIVREGLRYLSPKGCLFFTLARPLWPGLIYLKKPFWSCSKTRT